MQFNTTREFIFIALKSKFMIKQSLIIETNRKLRFQILSKLILSNA
jgi:hypothetical protein